MRASAYACARACIAHRSRARACVRSDRCASLSPATSDCGAYVVAGCTYHVAYGAQSNITTLSECMDQGQVVCGAVASLAGSASAASACPYSSPLAPASLHDLSPLCVATAALGCAQLMLAAASCYDCMRQSYALAQMAQDALAVFGVSMSAEHMLDERMISFAWNADLGTCAVTGYEQGISYGSNWTVASFASVCGTPAALRDAMATLEQAVGGDPLAASSVVFALAVAAASAAVLLLVVALSIVACPARACTCPLRTLGRLDVNLQPLSRMPASAAPPPAKRVRLRHRGVAYGGIATIAVVLGIAVAVTYEVYEYNGLGNTNFVTLPSLEGSADAALLPVSVTGTLLVVGAACDALNATAGSAGGAAVLCPVGDGAATPACAIAFRAPPVAPGARAVDVGADWVGGSDEPPTLLALWALSSFATQRTPRNANAGERWPSSAAFVQDMRTCDWAPGSLDDLGRASQVERFAFSRSVLGCVDASCAAAVVPPLLANTTWVLPLHGSYLGLCEYTFIGGFVCPSSRALVFAEEAWAPRVTTGVASQWQPMAANASRSGGAGLRLRLSAAPASDTVLLYAAMNTSLVLLIRVLSYVGSALALHPVARAIFGLVARRPVLRGAFVGATAGAVLPLLLPLLIVWRRWVQRRWSAHALAYGALVGVWLFGLFAQAAQFVVQSVVPAAGNFASVAAGAMSSQGSTFGAVALALYARQQRKLRQPRTLGALARTHSTESAVAVLETFGLTEAEHAPLRAQLSGAPGRRDSLRIAVIEAAAVARQDVPVRLSQSVPSAPLLPPASTAPAWQRRPAVACLCGTMISLLLPYAGWAILWTRLPRTMSHLLTLCAAHFVSLALPTAVAIGVSHEMFVAEGIQYGVVTVVLLQGVFVCTTFAQLFGAAFVPYALSVHRERPSDDARAPAWSWRQLAYAVGLAVVTLGMSAALVLVQRIPLFVRYATYVASCLLTLTSSMLLAWQFQLQPFTLGDDVGYLLLFVLIWHVCAPLSADEKAARARGERMRALHVAAAVLFAPLALLIVPFRRVRVAAVVTAAVVVAAYAVASLASTIALLSGQWTGPVTLLAPLRAVTYTLCAVRALGGVGVGASAALLGPSVGGRVGDKHAQ